MKRTWFVLVLLVLAGVVGAGTAWFVYNFAVEYGPTTGSWVDGARWISPAAAPLLLAGVLATVAFVLGPRRGLRELAPPRTRLRTRSRSVRAGTARGAVRTC